MLSAKDLFRYRQGLDKVIPQKGGEKEFLPDGSWLQEKKLESFNSERQQVLSEPRVQREGDLVKGEWNQDRMLVELKKEMRSFWEHMGFIDSARKWLYPEEALFLMETNVLEVWYNGLPLSISEGYMLFLNNIITLEYYQVFAHLRRIGYVVIRHQGRLKMTKYEQQIGLNTSLSRRERKTLQRKQRLELESRRPTYEENDSSTETFDSKCAENIDNIVEEMEVDTSPHNEDVTDMPDVETEVDVERNGNTPALGSLTGVNSAKREMNESDKASDPCLTEDVSALNHCETKPVDADIHNLDKAEDTSGIYEDDDQTQDIKGSLSANTDVQDISEEMQEKFEKELDNATSIQECSLAQVEKNPDNPAPDCSDLNSTNEIDVTKSIGTKFCRWNFNEIVFPDFGCNESVIVIVQPNKDQTPGKVETKCKSYQFERTQCINKKKEKRKNRRGETDRNENLKFSNPLMNEEMTKTIKSCTNWKEYKIEKTKRRALWNRKKAFPHLFEELEPLVKPEQATSTRAVLEQLHFIEEVPTKSNSTTEREPEILPNFDVYKPDFKFRKTSPGIPDHRVVVAKCSDPMPELSTICSMNQYLGDDVPLNWAVVESGNIAFFTISDFSLPLDITVG